MKISQDEFQKIFLKNLFKRLIDSYIVDDENLKKIIQNKGIFVRNSDYELQIQKVSEKLTDIFIQNFNNEQQINDVLQNSYRLKKWIVDRMKDFE